MLTSLGTSLSSIEDSITSATQVLPTVDTVKGWVKDAVTSERSAAPTTTAPTIPPHQTSCRTTMPSPRPPTMTGLPKLASDVSVITQAKDAWAHAPRNPGLGMDTRPLTGSPSSDGRPHADRKILTSIPTNPEVSTRPHEGGAVPSHHYVGRTGYHIWLVCTSMQNTPRIH